MPHKKQFQPYIHRGRFYNHADEKYRSTLLPSLIMLFEGYWNLFKRGKTHARIWYSPSEPVERSKNLLLTWIGHSTYLIQAEGINIITDPIFGKVPFFKRQLAPGISLKDLPQIDYVILSHNHHDHMDYDALNFLKNNRSCTFLVPRGDKAWFERRGITQVREYTWWEREVFTHGSASIEFSFLPAHHWSQRGVFDFNKSLWGSWMISTGGHSVYFAGDTAFSGHFSAIAKEFPRITHALMPIGPCEPQKWMKDSHINAEESGQAFLDLNAQKFFPMHWGTFSFGTDFHEAPYQRIVSWWNQQRMALEEKQLIVLKAGQRFEEQTIIAQSDVHVVQEPLQNLSEQNR